MNNSLRKCLFKNTGAIISITLFGWCSNLWAECTSKPVFDPTGKYYRCMIEFDGEQKILDTDHLPTSEECETYCNKHIKCQNPLALCKQSVALVPPMVPEVAKITQSLKHEEKFDSPKEPNDNEFLNFDALFEGIKKRDPKNPCKAAEDKTWLREKSLILMDKVLAKFRIPNPTISKKDDPLNKIKKNAQSKIKFNIAMEKMWRSLLTHLVNDKVAAPHGGEWKRIEETSGYLRNSLANGIIPLPHDETVTKQNHFSYTSLSQYFFYGIAPISLSMTSDEQHPLGFSLPSYEALLTRSEHPLMHYFLSSLYDLVDHDMQHAGLMSDIFKKREIEKNDRCFQFFTCLNKIPDINDVKKSKGLRLALFYLLHEDEGPFEAERGESIDPLNFAEFSMERLINDQKEFSIESLIGSTDGEREQFCAAVKSINSFIRDHDIKGRELDRILRFLSISFPLSSKTSFELRIVKTIRKDKDMSVRSADELGEILKEEIKFNRKLKFYFISSLNDRCLPYKKKSMGMPDLNTAKSILIPKLEVWGNRFHEQFLNRSETLATDIGKLIDSFEKEENCKDILRRSGT